MVITKRKKNSRQRAGTTHGWGSMKKHRGKGNKGGCGMAGTGKRNDAKKPSIWKNKKYFGKHGFKKKGMIIKIVAINISELELKMSTLLENKKINKEGDIFTIDLGALGYNKLLGTGVVKSKMKITVDSASEKAVSKIASNGGEVVTKKGETE